MFEDRVEKRVLTQKQKEDIGEFWGGIWGTEGQCTIHHPTLQGWHDEVREQGKPNPSDEPISKG